MYIKIYYSLQKKIIMLVLSFEQVHNHYCFAYWSKLFLLFISTYCVMNYATYEYTILAYLGWHKIISQVNDLSNGDFSVLEAKILRLKVQPSFFFQLKHPSWFVDSQHPLTWTFCTEWWWRGTGEGRDRDNYVKRTLQNFHFSGSICEELGCPALPWQVKS